MTQQPEPARPRPPWHPFPLSELVMLVASACALAAAVQLPTPRSFWLAAAAITLALLCGVEHALREHFAGWRSHSVVLAGVVCCCWSAVAVLLGMTARATVLSSCGAFLLLLAALETEYRARLRRRARCTVDSARGGCP